MNTRQLPRVWKWFWSLPVGTDFSFGPVKREVFFKSGLFVADSAERRHTVLVWPFQRVRTTVLVRDSLPGGKFSQSRDLVDATSCALQAVGYQKELQDRYSTVTEGSEIPLWARRIEFIVDGQKPFADDGRTGPSA